MAYNSTSWTTDGSTTSVSVGNYSLYAHFGIGNTESSTFVAGYHQPLTFQAANFGASGTPPAFGNGTDPATSFTTAESSEQRASDLVPCLWYLHDNIVIDSIVSLEGADTATGDTTRFHLMSYDIASGSTSALASGTLLAYSSDVTNAGSEQAYKSSWTISSSNVSSGKVILAFLESDSINSDYSVSVSIKYHLI
tara:strand:- start:260 stop:844 length:585 start_codon:yes stop_codon:yes gene_type:complete